MENSSKVSFEPKNENLGIKKWEVPIVTSLKVNKTEEGGASGGDEYTAS